MIIINIVHFVSEAILIIIIIRIIIIKCRVFAI